MRIKTVSYRVGRFCLVFLFLGIGVSTVLFAQQIQRSQPDSSRIDSLRNAGMQQQSGMNQGRMQPGQAGRGGQQQQPQQEGQVNFTARDSLIFNFNNQRKGTLFGESQVTYTSGNLSAGKISLDLNQHLVSAETQTPEDTLSQPVLSRENEKIRSNSISFNYQSEQGRFEVARMSMAQGHLIGQKVKNTGPHTVFVQDGIYSTCNLDHPHYYIKADRMKMVDRDEVFFTKARLYIWDIPYPLVFPFGYIPMKGIDQQQSGLLTPTYTVQETSSRGLGLQNLGWFQYFNEHLVGQASVDIFTSGSFYLNANSSYRVTDNYNGQVQIGYSRENSSLEPTDPSYTTNTQKRVSINHQQTISPYANFSTSIQYQTADYFKRNSYNPDERARSSTSSSINYRYRHPENLYSFSISARQSHQFQNNRVSLNGPTMNFSLKDISPFADEQTTGDRSFLESITIGYDNRLEANYDFTPVRGDSARINWVEALFDPDKYRQATDDDDHYRAAFRQNLNFRLGNLLNSNFVNLTPSFNYTEYWYPTSIRKSYNQQTEEIETRKVTGFEAAREFSTGANLTTTVYGMWNQRIGNISAFRHKVTPSVSFSYSPDFSSDFWGYYQEVETGNGTRTYSIFEDEVFRGPSAGEQRTLRLSLDNTLEAKQVKRDSLGEKNEHNLRLIDQFSLSTSYNFAADSMKLADLDARFSTSVVDGVNINASASYGFYQRDADGRQINRYLWEDGRPPELLNWNVSASTSFSGGGERGIQFGDPSYPATYDPLNQRMFRGFDPHFNQRPIQPLKSPWRVSFNFSYNWSLNPNGENNESATINANRIEFRLTPKWRFSTSLGYDFVREELTPSRFSLSRDLHCWSLSFEMNPFGDFQYFFFRLSVDSSQIQGLLQKLPGLNNLERSSSPTGRGQNRFGGF